MLGEPSPTLQRQFSKNSVRVIQKHCPKIQGAVSNTTELRHYMLIYIHLNAFFMLNQNTALKIGRKQKFEKLFFKIDLSFAVDFRAERITGCISCFNFSISGWDILRTSQRWSCNLHLWCGWGWHSIWLCYDIILLYMWMSWNRTTWYWLHSIHTLRVHYVHAAANLNSGYSKYAKVVRVHYFCTIALRTSRAVLTWASRRVDLREHRVDSFSKRVIICCW